MKSGEKRRLDKAKAGGGHTIKTELGIEIKTTKSFALGEEIAKLKETADDTSEKIKKRTGDLLSQMREDKVSHFAAKAPGGTMFEFDVVAKEEKVKIKKAKQ